MARGRLDALEELLGATENEHAYRGSVVVEIVVTSSEGDMGVDFQQALAQRISLLHVADVKSGYPLPCLIERTFESCIDHQFSDAAGLRVGSLAPGSMTGEAHGERSLPVVTY